ncbi:ABC transporter permease [Polynucleobacter sp. IMCC 29146]|jgi:ABC-type nitrate/sulfonate/bicarbonate transport system permease component|nr:ABC transporter permease [Polynucleobacter sp. IMCC 29146]
MISEGKYLRFTNTTWKVLYWFASPAPYLLIVGMGLFLGSWFLLVEVWRLPRFEKLPGLTTVIKEWLNPDPIYGLSFYTEDYYKHIWVSLRRVIFAFILATGIGVPLGLAIGWFPRFKDYVFPLFEVLRPIPILAWVPISLIVFKGSETPIIFLTFLAAFFVTTLNAMLGVQSIDKSYFLAADCLGASKKQVFFHIVIPGALPYIFTGLQISIGVCWFSLVAAEMVSGEYGLGYVINTAYSMIQYPTIAIGMITLGLIGYTSSALVRLIGRLLMQWRARELSIGGSR